MSYTALRTIWFLVTCIGSTVWVWLAVTKVVTVEPNPYVFMGILLLGVVVCESYRVYRVIKVRRS